MSSSLGQLTLDLIANTGGFQDGMDRAERIADKKLRAIEFAAKQRSRAIEDAFKNMASSLAAPLAAAFSVNAINGYVQQIRTAAVEVDRFAKAAGASSQEFQRFAHGASKAGMSVEKFAGVLKDVNDRVGEFAQTGGGPIKDFFTNIAPKVGVTAEAFRRLSGPQALGLYYRSLEKANLSHAEMTFYMEALASDASLLAPLLRDNAKGFKEAGDEAERLGLVMGDRLKRETLELDNNLKVMTQTAEGFALKIANVVIPELNELAGEFLATRQAGLSFWDAVSGTFFDGLDDSRTGPGAKIAKYKAELEDLQRRIDEMGGPSNRDTALMVDRANQLKGFISYTEIRRSADAMAAYNDVIADAKAGITDYTGAVQRLQSLHAGGAITTGQFQAAVAQLDPVASRANTSLSALAQGVDKTGKATVIARDALGELIERLEAKEIEEAAKAVQAYNDAWANHLDGLWAEANALEAKIDLFGKTEAEIADITLARAEERLEIAKATGVEKAYITALEQEVAQRRRIAEASRSVEVLEGNSLAALQAQNDWEDTSRFIEQSIYDAIVSGGEDAGDVLKRTFKALVLQPMIRTVAQTGANAVLGAFGMNTAGSGGSGSNALGLASNVLPTGSLVGNAALWAGGALGTGTALGGFATGLGTAFASGAGTAATWSAGSALAGTAGGGAAGAGMMVGAAIPWVAAAIAILSMVDWGGGTPHRGAVLFAGPNGAKSPRSWEETQAQFANPADANGFGQKDFYKRRDENVANALEPIAVGVADLINSTLQAFEVSAGYRVGLYFSADNDDKSRGGFSLLDAAGAEIADFARKYARDPQEGMQQLIGDLGAEVRDVLVSELPTWADDMLESLGDKPSMDALGQAVDQIKALTAASESLAPVLGLAEEAIIGVLQRVGGDTLAAYVDAYYSEADRLALATDQMTEAFESLGVAVPESKQAFRALVESIDASTEAGRDMYASLMALAPAFSLVAEAAVAAAQTMLDALNDDLQKKEAELSRAFQRRAVELEGLVSRFETFGKAIRDVKASLLAGTLSPLNPQQQYAEMQARFMEVSRRAQLGDVGAIEQLQSVSEQFLESSRGMFASGDAYLSDFDSVMKALDNTESVAERQVRLQREALDELKASVGELIDIDDGVSNLAAAVQLALADLKAVLARPLNPETGVTTQTLSDLYRDVLGRAPDQAGLDYWQSEAARGLSLDSIRESFAISAEAQIRALYDSLLGREADQAGLGYWMWQFANGMGLDSIRASFLESDEYKNLPRFASGGYHKGGLRLVGERGPELEATGASRLWSAEQTQRLLDAGSGKGAEIVAELRRLREELSELRREQWAQHGEAVRSYGDTANRIAREDRAARKYG